MRRPALTLALLFGAAHASAAPPAEFPNLGEDGVRDAFAVVTFAEGGEFPQFPQCAEPDVVCMDPPPFWLDTRVEQTIAGTLPPRLELATTAHFGMARYTTEPRPMFVWIRSDGRAYQMPRYAAAYVQRRADGSWVIPATGDLPGWLPCEAMTRRIELDPKELDAAIAVPRDSERYAEALGSGTYVDTPAGAMPRYGIPVAALADLLPAQGYRFRESSCPP
ncbi:hypothetical protein [Lysobacter humi (ex Lee et al. 2017)]